MGNVELHGKVDRKCVPPGSAFARSTPHSAFPIPHCSLKDAEREVLARVRLDVRQQLPQLDHREGRLLVQRRVRDEEAERAAAVRDAGLAALGGAGTRTTLSWVFCAGGLRSGQALRR